jgi:ubiquinone/menaquinone biosynthesis C-methylase UbiE
MDSTHRALIREQFTRQAVPFANAPAIRNVEMLDRIVDLSGAIASDTVLDVGCGPGLLACAFAARVRSVTGVDVTTAMLQQAGAEQRSRNLPNAHWVQADATCLPYRDDEFSLVTSRLTFHHLVQPLAVLREMVRICKPDGRVVVVDVSPPPDKVAAFDRMEKLRDPSHTHALPLEELTALFAAAGLQNPRLDWWRMEGELESLLARSFPPPGDDERVRQMFRESLEEDAMGIVPRMQNGAIVYTFPMVFLSATVAQ